ncbi:hypothetical protein [Ktedonobacter robiniae]|uniref:Lactococcin 972 family bacteriocin n=1 Tax=Ktedonobacter robiniae TaxID=2778365 RepID=A0ABQ3URP3_9CHLR|nr:hypothetical protein [Ktedonobacter robiniae]GHO55468.1 hypothetical protein KSB_39430 [Ktedonobacter robiniae]
MALSTLRKAVCLVMLSGVVAVALLFGSIHTASAASRTPTKAQTHATAQWGGGIGSSIGSSYSVSYSYNINHSFYRTCWYGCHYW